MTLALTDWVFCHPTCRRGRCWDLLNRLDRNFLHCLMELTLFYLRAISVSALYAKRQSASVDLAFAKQAPPQPFQCVPHHCWLIHKNMVDQGKCDNWHRQCGVKQPAETLWPISPKTIVSKNCIHWKTGKMSTYCVSSIAVHEYQDCWQVTTFTVVFVTSDAGAAL